MGFRGDLTRIRRSYFELQVFSCVTQVCGSRDTGASRSLLGWALVDRQGGRVVTRCQTDRMNVVLFLAAWRGTKSRDFHRHRFDQDWRIRRVSVEGAIQDPAAGRTRQVLLIGRASVEDACGAE